MLKTESEVAVELGRSIGRLASGVFVVTIEREGARDGMLATWIAQASFEPPIITLAVRHGRPILAALPLASHFVVNVLGKENMDIFKNFAKPDLPGEERYAGLEVSPENKYGPVFTRAVSYLNCAVLKLVEAGDHTLVLSEVVGGAILTDQEPMVHLRKSGFQY